MGRALIVARIQPGAKAEIARIFAESDRTSLPSQLGVRERGLYALGDLYVHVVDFKGDVEKTMAAAQKHPGFHEISAHLRPHVLPYDPQTWRSPRDAMADCFYHWRANG